MLFSSLMQREVRVSGTLGVRDPGGFGRETEVNFRCLHLMKLRWWQWQFAVHDWPLGTLQESCVPGGLQASQAGRICFD